jgi:hypothetical protein
VADDLGELLLEEVAPREDDALEQRRCPFQWCAG